MLGGLMNDYDIDAAYDRYLEDQWELQYQYYMQQQEDDYYEQQYTSRLWREE